MTDPPDMIRQSGKHNIQSTSILFIAMISGLAGTSGPAASPFECARQSTYLLSSNGRNSAHLRGYVPLKLFHSIRVIPVSQAENTWAEKIKSCKELAALDWRSVLVCMPMLPSSKQPADSLGRSSQVQRHVASNGFVAAATDSRQRRLDRSDQ